MNPDDAVTILVTPQQFEVIQAAVQFVYNELDDSAEVAAVLDELARVSEFMEVD